MTRCISVQPVWAGRSGDCPDSEARRPGLAAAWAMAPVPHPGMWELGTRGEAQRGTGCASPVPDVPPDVPGVLSCRGAPRVTVSVSEWGSQAVHGQEGWVWPWVAFPEPRLSPIPSPVRRAGTPAPFQQQLGFRRCNENDFSVTMRFLFNRQKHSQATSSPEPPTVGAAPPFPGTSSGAGDWGGAHTRRGSRPACSPSPGASPGSGWVTAISSTHPGEKEEEEERCFVRWPPTCLGGWRGAEPPVCVG